MGSDWELQDSDAVTASTDEDDDDLEITHILERKSPPTVVRMFPRRYELSGCFTDTYTRIATEFST